MRRLLVAAGLAVVMVLSLQTYAQAALYKGACKTVAADDTVIDKVCMGVDYHRIAGAPGVSVDRINISYLGGDMQSVDCYSIRIKNTNGVTWWVKQGGECDVPHYPSDRTFVPQQDLPQSVYADVVWSGNANLNNMADRDFTLSIRCDQ